MKSQNLFSSLLFLCAFGCSRSASIADAVTVEELHSPEGISEKMDVVEAEPIHVAEEVIRLEVEEPRMVQEGEEIVPYEVSTVHEEEVKPVGEGEENCEKPEVVEEQLIERAERQADEDLIKALDTVLTKRETIEDVIRTEEVTLPQF